MYKSEANKYVQYRYNRTGKLMDEYAWTSQEDIYGIEYTYDLRGNITEKDEYVAGQKTAYTYDLADHLLRADTSVNNTLTSRKLYTYDERGNLTAEQTRVYSSDGLSGSSISMTTGDTKLYSYDRFNRLTKYRSGSTEATYEYTADNLRASKTVNGKKTNFVWSGMNLMYEYTDNDSNTYAYDNTGILQSGTDTYLKDGHGNVIAKYNSARTKLSSTEYDAFGNIISGALSDSFGYCGEYLDSESGLIYLRNRYYDSATGRFITEDPAKDGVNWYSYCMGNPVLLIDPWGLTGRARKEEAQQFVDMIVGMGDIEVIQTPYTDENGIEWVDLNVGKIYSTYQHVGQTLVLDILGRDEVTYLFNQSYFTYGENMQIVEQPFIFVENDDGKSSIYFNIEKSKTRAEESAMASGVSDDNVDDTIYKYQYTDLGHEMLHAYHYYHGTFTENKNTDAYIPSMSNSIEKDALEEYLTVGVNCEDEHGNIYYRDSYENIMCENGIRLENGLPLRGRLR
ncbi:MAG: RHS repeat-associated core domain-containing protein [Candidatus Ornithomonoglobus sp.]